MALDPEEIIEHLPGLVRYARTLVEPDQAEDLVQDVVLRALERRESFRAGASPATWLHTIMRNRFIDTTRARGADPIPDDRLAEVVERAWRDDRYTVDADEIIARAQIRDDLYDALVHLPEILRSAVVLHDMEGLTMLNIADVQGISLPAAKQRLRRGRQLLITKLAGDDEVRKEMEGVPMRCWQARAKVGDYLDDELAQAERTVLERHLSTCPTCPGLFASIVGVTEALGRLRDPDTVVPQALAARLQRERD